MNRFFRVLSSKTRRPTFIRSRSSSNMAEAVEDGSQTPPQAEEQSKMEEQAAKCEELPKLTKSEFNQYNHMAEHMDYYVRLSQTILRPD